MLVRVTDLSESRVTFGSTDQLNNFMVAQKQIRLAIGVSSHPGRNLKS
jgi:hypothetical protein